MAKLLVEKRIVQNNKFEEVKRKIYSSIKKGLSFTSKDNSNTNAQFDIDELHKNYRGYLSLSDVPKEEITTDVIKYFVGCRSGMNLEHVDQDERTYELCKLAVKRSGRAFEFVPDNIKNKSLAFESAKSSPDVIFEEYYSKEYYSEALFECVLKKAPMLLKDLSVLNERMDNTLVEEGKLTELSIFIAASALQSLIEKDNKQSSLKLSDDYNLVTLLRYVPKELRTDSVYKYFIDRETRCLEAIDNPSKWICLYALTKDPFAYKYIKNKTKRMSMFLKSKFGVNTKQCDFK